MDSKLLFLKVGTKIDIFKKENRKNFYPSQVLEIIEPDELVIRGPMKKTQLVLLHKGEEIEILYYVENKGRFIFTAKVISRELNKMYTLRIKKISEIRKIQLRNYYRLPVTLEIEKIFPVINDDNKVFIEKCEAKDISGGGLKLYCNYQHVVGDEVYLKFKLENKLIDAKAKVVRIEEIENLNYKYCIGITFVDIEEQIRDFIVKFIFEQQRILRFKGLI
ncbi:MAG TPA: flagellar brake domain-containing protein [Tissierellaceae bacterium]